MLYSSGFFFCFFPFWKAKQTFLFGGDMKLLFFFLDLPPQINYIHAAVLETAFFSHAIKFAVKTKQRNNSNGLEKYSWNIGN